VSVLIDEIKAELENFEGLHSEVHFVSAATYEGLDELKTSMFNMLRLTPTTVEHSSDSDTEELPVIRPLLAEDHQVLELEEEGVFRIVHQKAVRLAKGSNLGLQEARIQYHKRLDQLKVTKALVDAGIEAGDTLLVGDWEFEWD